MLQCKLEQHIRSRFNTLIFGSNIQKRPYPVEASTESKWKREKDSS
jgi:hypothetical protein